MRLTIRNLTKASFTISFDKADNAPHEVPASLSVDANIPWHHLGVISLSPKYGGAEHNQPVTQANSKGQPFNVGKGICASWRLVPTPGDSPWRVYSIRVSRGYYKLLILPSRNLSAFLSEIPDTVSLSSLSLPGTHDTMAFFGWPISQCQSVSTPLPVQLQSGIRVIDIRLAVIDAHLIAYHGIYPERTPFADILSIIHTFLTAPLTCRETIVMSIKQEDFSVTPAPIFSKLVHDEIIAGPGGIDMWFLDNRVPTLGEVRGKILMFSRFGGDGSDWNRGLEGLGMHPTAWPDSDKKGFSWMCKDTLVKTQDWYNIPSFLSIPEKFALSIRDLLASDNPPSPTLAISFLSAASFPFAFPPTVAYGIGWPKLGLGIEGVNGRFGKWLLGLLDASGDSAVGTGEKSNVGPRIRGWVFMDFYSSPDDSVVPLLVECNFIGRKAGEEGWI